MAEVPASAEDQISRYIYSKNDFSSNGVKHSAFMPPGAHPNELSVCVITKISEEEVWKIGAETRSDKLVKARGDLLTSDVQATSDEQGSFLQVLIDGVPHPRHANIKSLPSDKSLQRRVATDLSNKARLKLPSS